jgi:hemoglobin
MGEENIFAMCRDFYAELERSSIRDMFTQDMAEASKKLAMFLVSATGGPALFQQAYGPPHMRARHIPFVIGPTQRQVWLDCFEKVLEQAPQRYHFPQGHIQAFKQYLHGFSAWMINSRQ